MNVIRKVDTTQNSDSLPEEDVKVNVFQGFLTPLQICVTSLRYIYWKTLTVYVVFEICSHILIAGAFI